MKLFCSKEIAVVFFVFTLFVNGIAEAASDTWSAPGGGVWTATTNWSAGVVPGASGTANSNQDQATFNGAGGTVTGLNTNQELGGFVFNSPTGNYTIGSSASTIYFHDFNNMAATKINISLTGTGAGTTQTINSNLMATNHDASGTTGLTLDVLMTSGYGGTLVLAGNIASSDTSSVSDLSIQDTAAATASFTNQTDAITISGNISDGVSGGSMSVYHAHNSVLLISGVNTYTGGFTQGINSTSSDGRGTTTQIGVDTVGSVGSITSSAFGTGTLTFEGGDISSDGTSARTIDNATIFTAGGRGIFFGDATNSGGLTFAGGMTIKNGSLNTGIMVLDAESNANLSGQISQAAGGVTGGTPVTQLTFGFAGGGGTGAGNFTLSNATGNTYTANTLISTGSVIVRNTSGSATGSGSVSVTGVGTTLGGNGIINTSAVTTGVAVNFAAGTVLNPSATAIANGVGIFSATAQAAQAPGINHLTFQLNAGTTVNLASGASLVFDLGANTASSDEVFVTGGKLSLNGQQFSDFTFNELSGFGAGTYILIDSSDAGLIGALSTGEGALSGSMDGGLYTGTISLMNGDLELTVASVPEPSTWVMMLGGLGLLIAIQVRHKKREQI